MSETMRRAFGYVRVSSPGQSAEVRDGIPRQKAALYALHAELLISVER